MSKITYKNIPDFGNPNKSEKRKKEETMMAWVGMTDVKDLEPEDRENFLRAIHGKEGKVDDHLNNDDQYEEVNSAMDNPIRRNYDYGGNFVDKVRALNKLKSLSKFLNNNNLIKDSQKVLKLLKAMGE